MLCAFIAAAICALLSALPMLFQLLKPSEPEGAVKRRQQPDNWGLPELMVWLLFPGLFLGWAAVGFTFFGLYEFNLMMLPPSEFVFRSPAARGVCLMASLYPGGVFFVCLGGVALWFTTGRKEMLEFAQLDEGRTGVGSREMAWLILGLGLVIGLAGAAGLLLTLPCYQRADKTAIAFRRAGAWGEEVYPLAQVTRLALSTRRHKNKSEGTTEPDFVVHVWMADERRLEIGDLSEVDSERFLDWLKQKTGVFPEIVDFPEELGK
jgi:hypothetical protein